MRGVDDHTAKAGDTRRECNARTGGAGEFWTIGEICRRQVETSRGTVEYADVGGGLPVLYFHGTGAGADAAVVMEHSLLVDGFRLIVPERPGYYGTLLSCGRTVSDAADLAAELLDRLGVERAAVIGTSGGGMSSLAFAARHPARTAALVLQCAVSHPHSSGRWMPQHLRRISLLFRHHRVFMPVLRLGFRRDLRRLRRNPAGIVPYMSGERYQEIHDDAATCALVPPLVDSTLRCAVHPAGIENDWVNMVGEPWLTPGSVSCRTLILHDRADPLVPLEHVEWARQCIPQAESCDLHAGGHLIWVGRDAAKMHDHRAAFIRRHLDSGHVDPS